MARPYLRKTLLALAIASHQQLLADTLDLTGSQATLYSNEYLAPLTITGQASGAGYAVDVNSWFFHFFPSITNQANLNSFGEETKTLSLSGSGTFDYFWGLDVIAGDLTNEGQITANGDSSSGIFLGNTAAILLGDLNNSGNITSDGTNSAGIRLSNLATIFGGGINNTGNISANGAGSSGISLESNSVTYSLHNSGAIRVNGTAAKGIRLSEAWIQEHLQNSGNIEVSGESSVGIALENDSVVSAMGNTETGVISASGDYSRAISIAQGKLSLSPTSLQNRGLIQTIGRESVGVYIDHPSNLSILINEGQISSQGVGSRAIALNSDYPDAPASSEGLWVINTGTLQAEGIAIETAPSPANYDGFGSWLQVDMWSGLISGGDAAIKGDGNVLLNFTGGEIRGNLLGLQTIYASGDALFNGQLIQSTDLWVSALELAQPHTRLDGNLNLGDSTLDLNLHNQTDSSRAIFDVSGSATFGLFGQSHIRLKPASEDFRGLPLREYVLISANSIEDQGTPFGISLQVTSLSDLLQIESFEVTDNQVTAVVKGLSAKQVSDYLRENGAPAYVLPAFTRFYGKTLGNLSDADPLFQSVISSNDAELVRLAQQLTPEVDGAASQVAASHHNLLGNALQNRSASLRRGLSSGDGLSQTGAWVQVLDSDADQDSGNGIPGYDADSQGIAMGADGKLNAQTTLGLAYSYLSSDVRSQSGNKTDIEGHTLTLYSTYEQDAWFADASLSYGLSDNQSKRYIAGTRARGDYDSSLWGLNLLGGYGFDLSQGVLLEPRIAARYSNVQIDSYREKGSSAALAVGSQRIEIAELGTGVRLAGNFAVGQGNLEPEAKLMAYHDFIADQASSTSAFLAGGTPFVTNGAKPARDSYEASLGLTYRLGAVSLGLSYDYLTKADYTADTVQARVRYDF
ncbi:MAG TPA: autotransporter outer membrane beta-barrel domain-containing protein [Pseudomonas sp.]|nr:autotransporter outer membrane beta-barrel domain-containing protein [Pseudomonas sp.]